MADDDYDYDYDYDYEKLFLRPLDAVARGQKWVPFPFNSSVSIIKLLSKYELKLVFKRGKFVLFTFTLITKYGRIKIRFLKLFCTVII